MAILRPYGFQETHSDDWVHISSVLIHIYHLVIKGSFVDTDTTMGLLTHCIYQEPPPSMAGAQSLPFTA